MSNHKGQIQKLRDNAELAWAAYGYFDRLRYNYAQDEDSKKALKEFREIKKDKNATITQTDILDITYKYHLDEDGKPKDSWYHKHFLGGDFAPLQAQNFFEKYDLLIHQPNTKSGFSATLFQHKKSKEYILAIRGTEPSSMRDIRADVALLASNVPKAQYKDMLLFYHQCIGNIPFYVERDSKEYIESRKVA